MLSKVIVAHRHVYKNWSVNQQMFLSKSHALQWKPPVLHSFIFCNGFVLRRPKIKWNYRLSESYDPLDNTLSAICIYDLSIISAYEMIFRLTLHIACLLLQSTHWHCDCFYWYYHACTSILFVYIIFQHWPIINTHTTRCNNIIKRWMKM